MTTVFCIALQPNGWLFVGDKLITVPDNKRIVPYGVYKKIDFIKNQYLIGFSGDYELYIKFKEIIIDVGFDFEEIKDRFSKKSSGLFSPELLENTDIMVVDVITNKKYVFNLAVLTQNCKLDDFDSSIDWIIGSGKYSQKFLVPEIPYFREKSEELTDQDIISKCVAILNHISLEDQKTGSPYIFGCNILIYRNGVKEYSIESNGCRYKSDKGDWIQI